MAAENKDDDINDTDIVVVDDPSLAVDAGELDSSAETDAEKVVQKKTPAKKRGNDQQKRINEIWLGRKQAEENALQEANLRRAAEEKNAQYEQITASALEENLNTKRELLKERLVRAQEVSDPNKIAEIQVELGKVEAQSAQIDRYKIENRVQPQQQQDRQQNTQQAPQTIDDLYEALPQTGKNWIDANREWYDPSSESYNSEMAADVTHYARMLEKSASTDAPPGTRAYFKKIDDYVKQNWGDNVQNDEEDEATPVPQKKNYAAPVGNRSVSANPPGARKEYKITQAEKEMALSSEAKDKTGRPLSDNDKIKRFISLREGTPSSGPISIDTIRRGV